MKKQMLFAGNDPTFYQAMRNRVQSEDIDFYCIKSIDDLADTLQKDKYCLVIATIRPSRFKDIEVIRTIRNT